ncbi:MAG: 2-amino-4-hydroxy-6-hydroxymethyldihydropteridine diphosphokinase [Anaerolineae bacterium]|nr:2-amino-4-hydroxy-6-hydroxymethyldihydropteridine diphosphokinase [Anaerolineae bacterium]
MEGPLTHLAYLSLGSNMDAEINLQMAVRLLRRAGDIMAVASTWETEAVGSRGPNFLNTAVAFRTQCSRSVLKDQVLHPIEDQLGRVRTIDKNAPRPIDIDIIIFDNEIIDSELWARLYIARPFAELIPNLVHPVNGKNLLQVANELHCHACAILHPEINLDRVE